MCLKSIHTRLSLVIILSTLMFSCSEKNDPSTAQSTDPKVRKLKLPAGFHADHLYGPSENGEGSWVSMTFDNKGRLLASDQYGAIYRMTLPPIGDTTTKVVAEKLQLPRQAGSPIDSSKSRVDIGYAHGLLWAFNSLYVMINHESDTAFNKGSGLYRLEDTNGDDRFDKLTLLKALDGDGEHGPHSIVLSPDKKSLFVIAGNFTKIPAMDAYTNMPGKELDNVLPYFKDPNGHDNSVEMHGGWIARINPDGTRWELYSSGFRNPFDMAFNDAGDLFTFDSDMEWDLGAPWYRPTRICHATSGSEFGWRPGDEKWSPVYPDNLPAILNIGQGSPTNVVSGIDAHFPEKYRRSIFAFDWSFGIIYAVHLEPKGASYEAKGEEFVSGSPLPLTDGVIGPDGALYFLTGGRRLESDLYRVYYGQSNEFKEPLQVAALNADQQTRRRLETYHTAPQPGAVEAVWPYLRHADRYIRYAARIALEHQPVGEWKEKLFAEHDPVTLTQAAIAYARKGEPTDKEKVYKALEAITYQQLSEQQRIDLLRAFELIVARMGAPAAATKNALITYIDAHYPASGGNELNRELVKLLGYLGAPDVVEKTVALLGTAKDDNSSGQDQFTQSSDLIMRNPQYGLDIAGTLSKVPPAQQTYYATAISQVKTGWTPASQNKYFKWFYDAFSYKGGHSFPGFIDSIRKSALKNVPATRFAYYNRLSGDSLMSASSGNFLKGAPQPKGPGRDWTVETAVKAIDSTTSRPDFNNGQAMFNASLCVSCHAIRGQGGAAGPDLTQLGTRFSQKDILESIIDPSKTISDQYAATIFELKGGSSVVGRLINQDDANYIVAQNPFALQNTRKIPKADVSRTQFSPISMMLPGLINRLNPQELKDLISYLVAGGNQQHPVYK